MNLSYSTFMQLLKGHSCYASQEELARNLLEAITHVDTHYKFTSTYLSYIWSGERNISQEVSECADYPESKTKCVAFFKDFISHDFSMPLVDDFYDKLKRLIESDETITESKRNSLQRQFNPADNSKYLSDIFLYSLKRPNKAAVESFTADDSELALEVKLKCPLCNTPLSYRKGGKTFYRFSITHIFPTGLDSAMEADFSSVHRKPANLNANANKICLCDTCASEYTYTPTTEQYDKIYRHKEKIRRQNNLIASMDRFPLEEQIIEILKNLKGTDIDSDSFASLRMKPLKLENKIYPENRLLKQAIANDNNKYFYFIQDYLSVLDDYSASFKKIALEVKLFFTEVYEKTNDQEEVFNRIVEWIMHTQGLAESYRAAAHIVVSYFVQNCEVFDEIPE